MQLHVDPDMSTFTPAMAETAGPKRAYASPEDHEFRPMKKARFHLEDAGDGTPPTRTVSPAPSQTFTDAISIAQTSATSNGTSKRPKKYICTLSGCGKAFDRPARLDIHLRSHTNERPFVCEQSGCGKTFQRNEHLKRHIQDKHSEQRDHVCDYITSVDGAGDAVICGKSFTTATRLRRHAAAHEAKEETTCSHPDCGKVFRKMETLQRHVLVEHYGEKPYKCTHVEVDELGREVECARSFNKPLQLKNHEAREHSGSRYFCDICRPGSAIEQEDDDVFGDGPPAGFSAYSELQEHLRMAHPPTCKECGKLCESNRALKAHVDIVHSALSDRQQSHLCSWPGCGRGFTKAGNLKVHIQSVHRKVRGFVCGEFDVSASGKVEGWNREGCGAAFGTKANLEEHVRTRHIGLPGKVKPSRQRKREERLLKGVSATPSSGVETDGIATPADGVALSMLTGHGYAELPGRQIACLVEGCQWRFGREYDLENHLDVIHGMNIDDIQDLVAAKSTEEMSASDTHASGVAKPAAEGSIAAVSPGRQPEKTALDGQADHLFFPEQPETEGLAIDPALFDL